MTSDPLPTRSPRSGAIAALLSAIFPGLGQAFLGLRRAALVFAVPVIVAIAGVAFFLLSSPTARYRVLDPSVTLALIVLAVALGIWWAIGIVHAWLHGAHTGAGSIVLVGVLIFTLAAGDAFATVQLWRVRNAGERIFTGDPLDETAPPATPSPTPPPPSWTPDPLATATQRPADYFDPSDDPVEPDPTIEPGPTPDFDITKIDAKSDGLLNVMLVGLDWQPGRDSKRTDTVLVVSTNPQTGEVLLFSFPRDSARFPLYNGGTYNGKLNTFARFASHNPQLYPDGGMRSLTYELGFLLGVPIDYYASVNMPGFVSVVDLVGGVDVCNRRNIQDDQLQFYLPPGKYHLSPDDALRYVRSRHGSGGDFGRNERQQQVLAALRKQLLDPSNITRLPDIVEALSEVINTDFPPDQIDQLVTLADEVQSEPSRSWIFGFPQWAQHLPASQTNGRAVQFLLMDKIKALSVALFGQNSAYYGKVAPASLPPLPSPSPVASAGGSGSGGSCP